MYRLVQDSFDRVLIAEATKIQSTCVHCGYVIVASVSEGLQDREIDHVKQCTQPKAKAASPSRSSS
jgi:hypothetical protein